MITTSGEFLDHNSTKFSFTGLSTDSKPTGTWDGRKIENGSTFFEMDTQNVSFYDASTDTWV